MKHIEKFKRMPDNGIIGDGVHISFAVKDDGDIIWAWIGTKQSGPILQYAGSGEFYNGHEKVNYYDGAWSPAYSRGDFRKNYSHGGHWSGHTKNLHPRIADGDIAKHESKELLIVNGADIVHLPQGIKGDITATSFDCSLSWSIYFESAKIAIQQRLTALEIQLSTLPQITKNHLQQTESELVLANVWDVIDTYKL